MVSGEHGVSVKLQLDRVGYRVDLPADAGTHWFLLSEREEQIMARKTKTWQEKLADAKAKPGLPKRWLCDQTKQRYVVPSPDEIEHIIRRVRNGELITMKQICEMLRQKHKVDTACPMTTGIFAWLIAHAADEAEQLGRRRVPPWWRVLKTGGELNPKYPGGGEIQHARLEAEGHTVVQRGKKLVVPDYRDALVGAMEPELKRGSVALQSGLDRRVLRRGDFGLCIALPKTEWPKLPDRGIATVSIDGVTRRVTVQTEQCNCRGSGTHEHRFLSLPASTGLKPGQRARIALAR